MIEFDPAAFHFIRPWWLLGIVPGVWLALLYLRRLGTAGGWSDRIEPALLNVLLERDAQRSNRYIAALVATALVVASIGMAGPTFARLPQPVEQRTEALVVVLDLSLSMLVDDTPPSRIVRARHKITDLLNLQTEGFVGLVAYAGDAHTVAPLTDDRRTVINLLNALSPEMMPVLGSRPGDAIVQAHTLLENAGLRQGRILMVTDGIERISDVTRHASRDVPISILGVGTATGAPIPLDFANQAGQVLRDDQGRPVIARLDIERLQTVAELCHGRYAGLDITDADIRYLAETPLPGPTETVEIERQFDTWADMGYWFALALLPFALFAFRRGVLVCLVLAAGTAGSVRPAEASWWDDLWERADQQAFHALQQGEPERAASLFRDPQWRGVADYRSDQFESAERAFSADSSATGHYNRGNALARQGKIDQAIEAYDATLALLPEHEDAAFNKALLERQQQQRQQQSGGDSQDDAQQGERQPGEQQDGSSDGSPGGDESVASEPQPEGQDGERQQSDAAGEADQQLAEQDAQASDERDELDDAMEQWLRRVPDDPGGLLRRKFQHETNQRRRRGESQSRQGERIW